MPAWHTPVLGDSVADPEVDIASMGVVGENGDINYRQRASSGIDYWTAHGANPFTSQMPIPNNCTDELSSAMRPETPVLALPEVMLPEQLGDFQNNALSSEDY